MGAVSEAIAASARAKGVEIRVNAPVAKILVRNGRAHGVVLESGEEIASATVASNLDPKLTFLRLLDPETLDGDFVRTIRNFRIEGTSCKINLALNGLPEFTAYPGAPGPHHRATMHICPSIEYVERAWDDAKYGRPSERPLLELTVPTMYDPSLAPPGKHIMGIFLQYAPYTLREGTWDELPEPFGDRVITLIEEYAPNIRSIVEHRQVLSPLDLERRFGITGGNIFHGEMSLDQMFVLRPLAGWARYRTPVKGLYLCGSGAHPGGGVMGAPGHNAAREMSTIPLRRVERLVSHPNGQGPLEKAKCLVLAVVNMGRRTSSRRDQNLREEKRSAGLLSGENEPDLISRAPVDRA
jgi:phytoene dehydrogenase-like protein